MRQLLIRLWREESGAVLGTEWAIIATILVLGAITGVLASRQTVLTDVEDPPAPLRSR
jgi:Flp pilus assembly pilin Flp